LHKPFLSGALTLELSGAHEAPKPSKSSMTFMLDARPVHPLVRFRPTLAQALPAAPHQASFNLHLAGWRWDYHKHSSSEPPAGF
jgi:hypothetical protein